MYLWKYLSAERTDVLANRKIRFTQAEDFNDPFEVVPYIAEFLPSHAEDTYLAQQEPEIREMYRQSLHAALAEHGLTVEAVDALLSQLNVSQSTEAFLTPGNIDQQFASLFKKVTREAVRRLGPTFGPSFQGKFGIRFGVLSLSANPTSLLMWAHYADCHRGFVVGFRAAHAFFVAGKPESAIGRVLPVDYAEERPAITMFDPTVTIELYAERIIRQVLLTKSKEWQYEQEHRLVLPLDDSEAYPHDIVDGRYHLFPFPADAIAAVILGARAGDHAEKLVRAALSSPELAAVPLLRARTSASKFAIEVERA